VKAFLDRPIEGDWPYLWIDATYLKVRRGGRIVSVAAIIAVGVNSVCGREVLGMEIGTSKAEPIWTEFCAADSTRGCRSSGVAHCSRRGSRIRPCRGRWRMGGCRLSAAP